MYTEIKQILLEVSREYYQKRLNAFKRKHPLTDTTERVDKLRKKLLDKNDKNIEDLKVVFDKITARNRKLKKKVDSVPANSFKDHIERSLKKQQIDDKYNKLHKQVKDLKNNLIDRKSIINDKFSKINTKKYVNKSKLIPVSIGAAAIPLTAAAVMAHKLNKAQNEETKDVR